MNRFLADGYTPIADPDPAITKRFRTNFEKSYTGNLEAKEYTPEFWQLIEPKLKEIEEEAKRLGKIESFTLVEYKQVDKQRTYRYLIEYEHATVLQRFVLNDQNQLTLVQGELREWKPK
jgi:hypothetical protein